MAATMTKFVLESSGQWWPTGLEHRDGEVTLGRSTRQLSAQAPILYG